MAVVAHLHECVAVCVNKGAQPHLGFQPLLRLSVFRERAGYALGAGDAQLRAVAASANIAAPFEGFYGEP